MFRELSDAMSNGAIGMRVGSRRQPLVVCVQGLGDELDEKADAHAGGALHDHAAVLSGEEGGGGRLQQRGRALRRIGLWPGAVKCDFANVVLTATTRLRLSPLRSVAHQALHR